MTFWQENYSFIKEVYDTRYSTTIRDKREWFRVQEIDKCWSWKASLHCCEIISIYRIKKLAPTVLL